MKHDNVKTLSGAELRALRDQRLTERTGPAAEAVRREASFLKNLTGAREDYLWIVEHEAWKHLGFASLTAWFETRARPLYVALGARPTPEIAATVIEDAVAENEVLPPAHRRSQREIAGVAMVSRATVARRVRPDPTVVSSVPNDDLGSDVEQPRSQPAHVPSQRPAEVPAATFVDPQPAAEDPEPEPARCPTCEQPVPRDWKPRKDQR